MAERNLVLFVILKTKIEVYKLTKERISIGRNRSSQIVINNNTISKDHAIIEFDQDGNAIITHSPTLLLQPSLTNSTFRLSSTLKATPPSPGTVLNTATPRPRVSVLKPTPLHAPFLDRR